MQIDETIIFALLLWFFENEINKIDNADATKPTTEIYGTSFNKKLITLFNISPLATLPKNDHQPRYCSDIRIVKSVIKHITTKIAPTTKINAILNKRESIPPITMIKHNARQTKPKILKMFPVCLKAKSFC